MTFDNGRECAHHYDIEREIKMTIYFVDTYKSRQGGTNEIIIGFLRQLLPKGSDFEKLTKKELQKYVTLINKRPREKLCLKLLMKFFIILKFKIVAPCP